MGEVNHTTECVTDLFSFVDFEWKILLSNSSLWIGVSYSENMISARWIVVGEVALSQDNPLSVDLNIFPDVLPAMKLLFPKPIAVILVFPIGEVTLSNDVPLSVDLNMVPELPTAIKVSFPKNIPLK